MNEYGIFGDEGQMERGFYTESEAQRHVDFYYNPEDHLWVARICHDHPNHEHTSCEECNA
jgi:hypothetical protein